MLVKTERSMFRAIMLVGAGGFIGSISRYLISTLVQEKASGSFPWWTFTVNILGCLIVGLLYGLFEKGNLSGNDLKSFLIVGFCGGFTTFSTFMHENYNLFQGNQFWVSSAYAVLSLAVGLAACWLGHFIAKL